MTTSCSSSGRRSFALISTLLVIAVLSILVAGFLASVRVERITARSYLNIARAELAACSALEAAKADLLSLSLNDHFIVVKATNNAGMPYYYIGNAEGQSSGQIRYVPLFSGGQSETVSITNMPTVLLSGQPAANKAPKLLSHLAPVDTRWIYVTNTAGDAPVMRFAYWTEDLGGYLDAQVVGNIDSSWGNRHSRRYATNGSDISLYSLFTNAAFDTGGTTAGPIITNRSYLFTPETIRQVVSDDTQRKIASSNLVANIGHDSEQAVIPYGFGYVDQGKPKYKINDYVTAKDVTGLAQVIRTNLPQFATTNRFGGMANANMYLNNLAANIIDYADSDSNPTVGSDYRGIDSYPFMTSLYYQFIWRKVSGQNWYKKSGTWHAQVDMTIYFQLWNLCDKQAQGSFTFDDSGNKYGIYFDSEETPVQPRPGGSVYTQNVNMQPNEFFVLKFGPVVFDIDSDLSDPNPPASNRKVKISLAGGNADVAHWTSTFECKWNGVSSDRPTRRTGPTELRVNRKNGTLDPEGTGDGPDWRGCLLALRVDEMTPYNALLGDPRATWFIDYGFHSNDYDRNGSWWGRHYARGLKDLGASWTGHETLVEIWPSGGHSTARAVSIYDVGTSERNRNETTPMDPSVISRKPLHEPKKAPAIISNRGRFDSITELGRVFDPVQFRPQWRAYVSGRPYQVANDNQWKADWQALHDEVELVSEYRYGGGMNLRIGRAEFKSFDRPGLRSSQLMDLLCATNRVDTRGLVNVNTASREVLRALGAGIRINADKSDNSQARLIDDNLTPATPAVRRDITGPVNPPGPGAPLPGDKFADAIIRSRPLLSTAQLNHITALDTNGHRTAFFGNREQWNTGGPDAWSDEAAREMFRLIYPLTTVRNRNFRVFVVGQALGPNEQVLATANRVFQVYLNPNRREPDGKILSQAAETVYESSF
jgi:hypothetical protein